jgi:hypothetical protein
MDENQKTVKNLGVWLNFNHTLILQAHNRTTMTRYNMRNFKFKQLIGALVIVVSGFVLCFPVVSQAAVDSSSLRAANNVPQKYQSFVNTSDCINLTSSPYVIVLGNGGANMTLNCPASKPVMYSWQQNVGFGGLGAVSAGGGRSYVTCCSVGHKWSA